MDIQINANQIIDKLKNKIASDAQTICTLEVLVELLKDELNTYQNEEHVLKL